jgi:hypothetical protein
MRVLERNKQTFYYSLFEGESEVRDYNGNPLPKYSEAFPCRANISAARGYAENEQFGNNLDYDRVIITDDMKCPITEESVLFVDILPDFNDDGKPLGDYYVKAVARSLNNISYAISKVDIS